MQVPVLQPATAVQVRYLLRYEKGEPIADGCGIDAGETCSRPAQTRLPGAALNAESHAGLLPRFGGLCTQRT